MPTIHSQVNMTEKDYQRKKNKFLPKIHAWYVFMFAILFLLLIFCLFASMDHFGLVSFIDYLLMIKMCAEESFFFFFSGDKKNYNTGA